MSVTLEPKVVSRSTEGGINLVALARPYFGLIVLTTALLTAFGMVSMLRMPSGIYPEVAFPRIVVIAQSPGLAVKDVEVAVTRPIEEAVSIVLGVDPRPLEIGPRRRRAVDRLRPRHRHDPGAQRRPRPHGRGRRPIAARHDHDHRAADPVGLPDHLVRRHGRPRPVGPARLRLLRPAAPDQPHPRRVVRHGPGGRHPRDPGRGRSPGAGRRRALDRRRGRSPGQGAPAQGRRPARSRGAAVPGAGRHPGHRPAGPGEPGHRRQERPADPAPRPGPGDDLARGPDDGDPLERQRRRGADRLSPPGRQRLGRLARAESGAGRRRQDRPRPA